MPSALLLSCAVSSANSSVSSAWAFSACRSLQPVGAVLDDT